MVKYDFTEALKLLLPLSCFILHHRQTFVMVPNALLRFKSEKGVNGANLDIC